MPKGQTEAARALGMSEPKILMRIVFPQVFKVALPQLTSEFINVIKVSPMLSVLAIVRVLTRTAQASCNADIHKPAFLYCYRSYVFCYLHRT